MTPHEFIRKWQNSQLKERAAAQEHFLDLCHLLGEKTPAQADATGLDYAFEVGATKTGGGHGFADVFKRSHFAWEYKGTRANLDAALLQLQRYAVALDNPPLLIVCDVGTTIRIHTNWTNSVSKVYEIAIDDLADPDKRGWLKAAFSDPEVLRPTKTRQQLTEEVAGNFAELARSLRARYGEPEEVAHFINRLVFCMFAEDVKLLKDSMFTRMLERALDDPSEFENFARDLFRAMSKPGGRIGFEKVAWFNGGLFDTDRVFALTPEEIRLVHDAASRYWGDIDPSILGTLFERGLDPDKRSQLGAHYTDRDKIMMIIEPVIVTPLLAEWQAVKAKIETLMAAAPKETPEKLLRGTELAARTRAMNAAEQLHRDYLGRLRAFRVLDPACGSGNFLYLALRALKDLEHRAQVEGEALGLERGFPTIGPEVVKGIEINPYAAELARVSVWIGEIQWMLKNGFPAPENPVLKPLETIECRDALLNKDGTEALWPEADAIIGNPPFLGAKLMKRRLGIAETERIRTLFADRLPGFTDLVCYWFEKSRDAMVSGRSQRAGLVATNSIAKNTNLPVLRRITDDLVIYSAYSDEPWVVDGAAVRVALISFVRREAAPASRTLNDAIVGNINANLTVGIDLSHASALAENRSASMLGIQKSGPFDVTGEVAREWLRHPVNPNGRPNSAVLKPYWNGDDMTSRPRDMWFIDLPRGLNEAEASLFEAPFAHLVEAPYDADAPDLGSLKSVRATARDRHAQAQWWEPYWPRPQMRRQIETLPRYAVTPETAEYRLFFWLRYPILPDKNLIVIAKDDDATFGILHSRVHELWATVLGNRMGVGNQRRYNNLTCFETFPFPEGLTPNIPAADYADDPRAMAIAKAAARLNELRENWLNPPDLVRREPEVVPGYPDRILPVSPEAEAILKKRTLTNLYNARPTWLANAHKALDEAVAAAYGWPADLSDDEVLARLFALNQERAAAKGRPAEAEAEAEAEADDAEAKPERKPRKRRTASEA
ncbi:class I SAM-dependent DNA methyltransferase [Roseixanthobacter glucoisosaccharinicivorans]|uniref:class I SAM-dependent DNA methyltransferase n=1 Tax=Roseixanthobacter glucoisosaccharinicivorans TaxID=3119923 RepID=UPI00372B0D32